MYIVCVQIKVKPEHVDAFINATHANHVGTRQESGNVRFDLLQAEDDPTKFFLYEVYHHKDDFPKHQQTEHYLLWKQTVAEWMAEPRIGLRYQNLFPSDVEWNN